MNLDRALATPGFTSTAKLLWLAQQARHAQVVVEIGSWMGRSTLALAENVGHFDPRVYAVDDWRGPEHSPQNRLHFDAAYDAFYINCADLLAEKKLTPLRVASPAAVAKFLELEQRPIDLLFIDGLHTLEAVRADLAAWLPLMAPGGLVCGDDFSDAWPGVVAAVRERFQSFDLVDGTDLWFTRDTAPLRPATAPAGTRLMLATPAYAGVTADYALSLVATTAHCLRAKIPFELNIVPGDSLVPRARNGLAAAFLRSSASHLVFLDADVAWRPHDLLRLVACPARHDVLCGIYPKKESPRRWPLNFLPNAQERLAVCNSCGALEIAEGPTGFMAIRRETLERLALAHPQLHGAITEHMSGTVFFSAAMQGGGFCPEDYGFCRLVRGAGMRVWALPDIPLMHGGTHGCLSTWLREEQGLATIPPKPQNQEEEACVS